MIGFFVANGHYDWNKWVKVKAISIEWQLCGDYSPLGPLTSMLSGESLTGASGDDE